MLRLVYCALFALTVKTCWGFTVLIPLTSSSSYEFLRQLRIFDNALTVCDSHLAGVNAESCNITLSQEYGGNKSHLQTVDMFNAALKLRPDEQVFLKADDDLLFDYDYILQVEATMKRNGKVYFGKPSSCTTEVDGPRQQQCMERRVYGASRSLIECFVDSSHPVELNRKQISSYFGDAVYKNCKYLGVNYLHADDQHIWYDKFQDMNKCALFTWDNNMGAC
ncbi:hypothetical protein NQZ79_g4542 [Umbelopsis isabellina]|nr:hypothetical protein NQZ79_g4542 [Umbelopsis isabellina]